MTSVVWDNSPPYFANRKWWIWRQLTNSINRRSWVRFEL